MSMLLVVAIGGPSPVFVRARKQRRPYRIGYQVIDESGNARQQPRPSYK